ncbi:MAG: sigma-70 family RNA polymerase sigma factor [Nannocystaceae bacterium]
MTASASASDDELLEAWRAGDRRAGGDLIGRYFRPLYRFFASKVRGGAEVEELVQRTFTAATSGVDRFRGQASARTWLFAIARNVLKQWYERQARARAREGAPPERSVADLGVGPNTALELQEEQRRLVAALQRQPLDAQILLELTYWERLTARELAAVFDVPEGTIRTRLRKAKLDLRGTLDALARTRAEVEATMMGLETWAGELRDAWQR